MKKLNGSEKQIAWAESIRENLIKLSTHYETVISTEQAKKVNMLFTPEYSLAHPDDVKESFYSMYKLPKIIEFINWFCEECDEASSFIEFKDCSWLRDADLGSIRGSLVKMASRPEIKPYADKFFA